MSVLLTDQRAATGSHDDSPSRPLVAETHRLLYSRSWIITCHNEGDGRLRFSPRLYVGRYIGIYVCEQRPGANSSPIVTLGHRERGG